MVMKFYGVLLPPPLIKRLNSAKWKLEKSAGEIVRQAVTEYLDKAERRLKGKKRGKK